MSDIVKKIQYLYFLLFRKPSDLQIIIQKYNKETKAGGYNSNLKSYSALKRYQRKLRRFLALLFLGIIVVGVIGFVGTLFLLRFLFNFLRVENNPFDFMGSIL